MIELRRHLVVIAVGVALVAIFIPAANAAFQGGRRTPAASYYDGTSAYVAGSSFGPPSGHCVLYSVLVYDETDPRQLETGLVRCSGATIDGSCDDVKFVETFDGSTYTCYPHGSFTNGVHYYFDVKRAGNADGRFYAHIGSSQSQFEGQHQFSPSDTLRRYAWGERTGSDTACSGWSGSGDFIFWQKFSYDGGWDYLHGSVWGSCWAVSAIDSYGSFSVSH